MKQMISLALALGMSGAVCAQTMKIHTGAVTTAIPAAEAGNMTYGMGGTTLMVMGKTFQISDIDSITVDREQVNPCTVAVNYDDSSAHVLMAGDLASYLTVNVAGADVSVVAAMDLQKEVFYTLRGSSTDGSFFMDGDFKSTLTLDNLSLSNKNGGAIEIANGKRIDVVLPENTVSTLSDGPGLQKACFFVNGHPEFSGAGTLQLTGNAKHAFASDEYTRFKSKFGLLKVMKAEGDGMHIEQYLKMEGGQIDISGTKGDCIDVSFTKNPTDTLNGQAFIEGGQIRMNVTSPDTKGLKVDSIGTLTISGGSIQAQVVGDGCKGISVGGNLLVQQKTVVPTEIKMNVSGTTYLPGDVNNEAKCRGIRGKSDFIFDGGRIEIMITSKKAKAVKIDGTYFYKSGLINANVDAAKVVK